MILINKLYFNLTKIIVPYMPVNDTWGWFIDTDTNTDTNTDTDTNRKQLSYTYDSTCKIRNITSYKSVNNLHDYIKLDNKKYKTNSRNYSELDTDNDNESSIGLCIVGTVFVCSICLIFNIL